MKTTIDVDPATETYEAVENLINHLVWKFVRRGNGEFDELKSIANLTYWEAQASYEPGHGTKFTSYISTCIWRRLLSFEQRRISQALVTSSLTGEEGGQVEVEDRVNFLEDSDEFQSMTEDAKTLIQLALDTPSDLLEVITAKGGAPRNYRSAIKLYAWEKLQWHWDRVLGACQELEAVLDAS